MRSHKIISVLGSALVLSAAVALPAFGADADWVSPVNEGVKSMTSSIVSIAGGVLGLAIVGYAVWGALNQRLNKEAFFTLFVCGLLIGIGPTAVNWWLDMFKS